MKRTVFIIIAAMLLVGCGSEGHFKGNKPTKASDVIANANEKSVAYMNNGYAQYKDGIYTILFSFLDENKEEIWINCDVTVKIKNTEGTTVYERTHTIMEKSYGTWSGLLFKERMCASIKIEEADIEKTNCENGVITLDVVGKSTNMKLFEGYEIDIEELPHYTASDKSSLSLPQFPLTFNEYNWNGSVSNTIKIENIKAELEDSYDGNCNFNLTFTGSCTKGTGYVTISYKLYDDKNYVCDSGMLIIGQYSAGDKFNNVVETIYGIKPGNYRLELTEYK